MSQSYIVRPLRSVQTYGTRNADAAQQRSKDIFQQALQHLNARESHLKQQSGNAFTRALSPTQREKLVSDVQWAQRRTTSRRKRVKSAVDGQILAIKDNFCTLGNPTTCASGILQGFLPPRDAWAVHRLKVQSGALPIGNTNMDEFGMGSHSTHSCYGSVENWMGNHIRSAGGSSGGSALAVLTNQCHYALGTDTGGSVRLPAAYTGSVGFKPSYGMISRNGVIPYANSLDTVGIIARSASDIYNVFERLSEPDPRDPTCVLEATRQKIQLARRTRNKALNPMQTYRVPSTIKNRSGLTAAMPDNWDKRSFSPAQYQQPPRDTRRRIGVPVEYNIQELSGSVRNAWLRTLSFLEQRGHEIVSISLPATKHALSAYYVLAPAEASSNLAKYDGVRYGIRPDHNSDSAGGVLYSQTRGQNFGAEVQRRILLGAFSLSADAIDNYFIKAQRVRRLVQKDFDAVFRMKNPLRDEPEPSEQGVDLIICPTAPTPPPLLEDLSKSTSVDAYMNDIFTVPASLAGLPAISVPAPQGDPTGPTVERFIGMQVIGQYGDDWEVLRFAANEMQVGHDWHSLRASTHVREDIRIR